MPSKDAKKRQLEKEYEAALKEIEEAEDEEEENPGSTDFDSGDIVILRGKARDDFLSALTAAGIKPDEAEEIAEEIEDKVEEDSENEGEEQENGEVEEEEEEEEEEQPKKVAKKVAKKAVSKDDEEKKDPTPPEMHRFFRGKQR